LDDGLGHSLTEVERVPQLVVALEGDRPLAGSARFSLRGVDEVVIGRGLVRSAERRSSAGLNQLLLSFPARSLSSIHARILRSQGQWLLEDAGSRNGSFVDGRAVERATLSSASVLQLGHVFFLLRTAMLQVQGGEEDLDGALLARQPLATRTLLPTLTRSFESVARVAKTGLPILISGDTGTGKEELARAIHELSDREGPLLLAPCGALSVERLEALAAQASQGGTLFLDEISDLSEATQVALLALLDSLPATAPASPKRPELLFISSSHLKPVDLLTAPRLRRDLHARLSGYVVSLPRLSERLEDMGNLVSGILQCSPELAHAVRFTASAGTALFTHDWPLNVRELKNALLSSVTLTEGGVVHLAHLPVSVTSRLPQPLSQPQSATSERSPRSDEERRLQAVLISSLAEHRGNVAAVSRALDKAPMQVHRWMKRFNIDPGEYRGPKKT